MLPQRVISVIHSGESANFVYIHQVFCECEGYSDD